MRSDRLRSAPVRGSVGRSSFSRRPLPARAARNGPMPGGPSRPRAARRSPAVPGTRRAEGRAPRAATATAEAEDGYRRSGPSGREREPRRRAGRCPPVAAPPPGAGAGPVAGARAERAGARASRAAGEKQVVGDRQRSRAGPAARALARVPPPPPRARAPRARGPPRPSPRPGRRPPSPPPRPRPRPSAPARELPSPAPRIRGVLWAAGQDSPPVVRATDALRRDPLSPGRSSSSEDPGGLSQALKSGRGARTCVVGSAETRKEPEAEFTDVGRKLSR